ncbi:progonadoliberin-1 isoform X2 [Sceloporus undulatus]|uniref:progonadoliberin-1 isoform X2 n=1 Tax=Sceloporus undulatus TaxID=8520 RepID=UPI001C4BA65B|nr:progonadoliberin-1 isoform X2 [Sceloporus undulatus]
MKKMGLLFVGFFLLATSPSFCSAQHWSYGFRPGGKRDAETLREDFEEPFANKMDKPVELPYFQCNMPCQDPTLTGLKGKAD